MLGRHQRLNRPRRSLVSVIGRREEYSRAVRALILTQYFTPELTAGAARLHAFASELARRGHRIEVICEIPNHPQGVVEEGYRGRLVQHRTIDGFDVTYVWVPTSRRKTTGRRLANYAGYAAGSVLAAVKGRDPDVVLASSPPLPVGVAGATVARRYGVGWVLDVRDMWPAAAVAVGELNGARAIAAAERLERSLYASASAIITPSPSSAEQIAAIAGDRARVEVVASGTTRAWIELGEREPDRAGLGLPVDEFVWTYAGNLGLAQGLSVAVRAAELLGAGFRLLIVGDGPQRAELEALARSRAAGQVQFTGLVGRQRAGELMRASDALLVSLLRSPGLEYAVPSKLYDCCAVARPVIVAAAGEARRLASEHSIGLSVDPDEPEDLARAVRRLCDEPGLRDRLADAGARFAAKNLRESQVDRLEAMLDSVARFG